MRAVLQRVASATVTVDEATVGSIGNGLLVLLGVADGDTEKQADILLDKAVNLRIFEDDQGKMNLSVIERGFGLLVVSQFTLLADTRRGRRPSFIKAAHPIEAERLYNYFVDRSRLLVRTVETGRFGAMMDVTLVNSGPVTILLDTHEMN